MPDDGWTRSPFGKEGRGSRGHQERDRDPVAVQAGSTLGSLLVSSQNVLEFVAS